MTDCNQTWSQNVLSQSVYFGFTPSKFVIDVGLFLLEVEMNK